MYEEIDLSRYVLALKRRWAAIAALAALAMLTALGIQRISPPIYRTQVVVKLANGAGPIYSDAKVLPQVVRDDRFLDALATRLLFKVSAEELRSQVRVVPLVDTASLEVQVYRPRPAEGAAIAQTIGQLIVERSQRLVEQRRAALKELLSSLEGQAAIGRRLIAAASQVLERRTLSKDSPREITAADMGTLSALTGSALYWQAVSQRETVKEQLLDLNEASLISGAPPGRPVGGSPVQFIISVGIAAVAFGGMVVVLLELLGWQSIGNVAPR